MKQNVRASKQWINRLTGDRKGCEKIGTHVNLVHDISFIRFTDSIPNVCTSGDTFILRGWRMSESSAGMSSFVLGSFASQAL